MREETNGRLSRCHDHRIQTGLRLLGDVGEEHREQVTGVTVSRTGDDDAGEIDLFRRLRCLHRNRHLCPYWEGGDTAELDAVFADMHGVSWKIQLSRGGRNPGWLKRRCISNFSCAHMKNNVSLAHAPDGSNGVSGNSPARKGPLLTDLITIQ